MLKVFEILKKQEETRQAELAAKVAEFNQMKAQLETVSFLYVLCKENLMLPQTVETFDMLRRKLCKMASLSVK